MQFVFSNMLNTVLEKNHEEMYELHHKHELMENHLVRKKHSIPNAQSLLNKLKLAMACEDPNYKCKVQNSPAGGDHGHGFYRSEGGQRFELDE